MEIKAGLSKDKRLKIATAIFCVKQKKVEI